MTDQDLTADLVLTPAEDRARRARTVAGLSYLCCLLAPVTLGAGLVAGAAIAFGYRGEVGRGWIARHLDNVIQVFWTTLILIGFSLFITWTGLFSILGWGILVFAGLVFAIRIGGGFWRLRRGRGMW